MTSLLRQRAAITALVVVAITVAAACGGRERDRDRDRDDDQDTVLDGGLDAGGGDPDAGPVDGGGDDGGTGPRVENTNALCSDGLNNDGDAYTDCADFDCSRNAAVTVCGNTNPGPENTNALCADGVSNDGDSFVDCADFDCSENPQVTVCGGAQTCGQCTDGATNAGGACSSQFDACGRTVACQSLILCLTDCAAGDSACTNTCVQQNPQGAELYLPLVDCLDRVCGSLCNPP